MGHPRARGRDVSPGDQVRVGSSRARVGGTWRRRRRASASSGHPRARGRDGDRSAVTIPYVGSSPRAWAGRKHPLRRGRQSRVIPARAGGISRGSRPAPSWSGHPRARGRGVLCLVSVTLADGSSPHAGAGPDDLSEGADRGRFLPTDGGRTTSSEVLGAGALGHPRRRRGSIGIVHLSRPVPTRVDGRWRKAWRSRRPPVHPHPQWWDSAFVERGHHAAGLSPHTWTGTPSCNSRGPGVIPACRSGKLDVFHLDDQGKGSSPRAWTVGMEGVRVTCGVDPYSYVDGERTMASSWGGWLRPDHRSRCVSQTTDPSPPRRARRPALVGGISAARFIPAHAGGTRSVESSYLPMPDHPRAHWQGRTGIDVPRFSSGSSP